MATASIWRVILSVLLCFFCLQVPADAQPLSRSPEFRSDSEIALVQPVEEQPSTSGLAPGVKVEIAKIRSGVLPGVLLGGHYDGIFKTRKQQYVATGRLDEQLADSVRYLLEDELSQAGFEGTRSHTQSVFEELLETSEPGRFLIGGTITRVQLNSYSSLLGEFTRDERRIRWEVFDRDLSQVVFRQELDGSAQAEGIDNPAATYEAIRSSFRQLLANPRLLALLNHPAEPDELLPAPLYRINAIATTRHPLTLEQLVGRSIPSIVQIRTAQGQGSGFLLDSSGLIVTNQHVVGAAFSVKVTLYDDTTLTGHVLRRDTLTDAALVKLEGQIGDIAGLPICHTDAIRVGQSVVAIGNPLSLTNTVTQGIVSSFRQHPSRSLIQTDAAINPGNSGGPLLNRDGTVIGIVTEKIVSGGVEGLGFALPIGEVLQRLQVTIDSPSNTKLNSCGNPLGAYP